MPEVHKLEVIILDPEGADAHLRRCVAMIDPTATVSRRDAVTFDLTFSNPEAVAETLRWLGGE